MSESMKGKSVVVTGASAGIGAALTRGLRDLGARVIAFDLAPHSDADEHHECDVASADSVTRAVEAALAHGPIDIVINNAGVFSSLVPRPFWELDPAQWDHVFAVNARGTFLVTRALVPHLPRGGSVINIASGTVWKGTPGFAHYVASKGAVVAMTHCMARELGPRGVRVNAIAPGLVMTDAVGDNSILRETLSAPVLASRALPRHETPEDLVGAAAFLCSEASAFMTGQVLVVDGGSVMR